MKAKLIHPAIILSPEAVHQLQNLLCTGSALAAHAERYARSYVIRYEISALWNKQLKQIRPWLTSDKPG